MSCSMCRLAEARPWRTGITEHVAGGGGRATALGKDDHQLSWAHLQSITPRSCPRYRIDQVAYSLEQTAPWMATPTIDAIEHGSVVHWSRKDQPWDRGRSTDEGGRIHTTTTC